MKKVIILFITCSFVFTAYSRVERDILQKEAKEINLAQVLVKNFSNLNFPDYYHRDFWNNLPEKIRDEYIKRAERYLDYNWPVVKATDYLEIIRSGDRRQATMMRPPESSGASLAVTSAGGAGGPAPDREGAHRTASPRKSPAINRHRAKPVSIVPP